MTEIESTLQRIQDHKGVSSVLILNSEGTPLKPSKGMDDELSQKYSSSIAQLTQKARSVIRDLDPTNELTFLRIRSKKNEILVAPDKDYLLVVIQDPSVTNPKKLT